MVNGCTIRKKVTGTRVYQLKNKFIGGIENDKKYARNINNSTPTS